MAKDPKEMTDDELTVDLYKRADSLDHLTAKAELDRRARVLARRNSRYQLAAVCVAAIAAIASAVSAYLNYAGQARTQTAPAAQITPSPPQGASR